MLTLKILRRKDRLEYNRLALIAYAKAKGFTAEEKAILWGPLDESFYQLGLFDGNRLVSNMRLEWLRDAREFKGRLKYEPREGEVPCAYLNIAATDPEWQGKGLNSIIRYFCLKAVGNWPVNFIFGSMVPGSPRIQAMKRMGYEFWESTQPWATGFKSEEMPLIARLDLRHQKSQALKVLESESQVLLKDIRLDFPPESLRMRTPKQQTAIFNDYQKFFGDLDSRRT